MARNLLSVLAILTIQSFCVNAIPSSSRIVGGQEAKPGQFPYAVSLQTYEGRQVCGATIISDRFILTAAHCVPDEYPVSFFRVRIGSINRIIGGEFLELKRIIPHKDYGNFRYDIALLELNEPLTWSDTVQPIKLATEEVPNGANVTIAGWGRLSTYEWFADFLQWTTVKNLEFNQCDKEIHLADESIMCLSHKVNQGACFGDSGGPAVYDGTLVGVAAFIVDYEALNCGSKYPDGYTKVSYYLDWISENMKS